MHVWIYGYSILIGGHKTFVEGLYCYLSLPVFPLPPALCFLPQFNPSWI